MMEAINTYDEPGLHDPAMLAQRLLEQAYRSDVMVACAECFSGGSIAAKLGAAEMHRQQFAGGFILNCEQAIGELLGRDVGYVHNAAPSELALAIVRAALRSTGASLALGVVAPRGVMRMGPMTFVVANDCGKWWEEEVSSRDLSEREIVARGLAFFLDCLDKSNRGHF